MAQDIVIYWVLPSLVTSLLMIHFRRAYDNTPLAYFTVEDLVMILITSFLYPIGLLIIFSLNAWPALLKEREYPWSKS